MSKRKPVPICGTWVELSGLYPNGKTYLRRRFFVGKHLCFTIHALDPDRLDEAVWSPGPGLQKLRHREDAEQIAMRRYLEKGQVQLDAVRRALDGASR